MYQTVGHHAIEAYAECLGVPLIRHAISGQAVSQTLTYSETQDDEVEDLYQLLIKVKVNLNTN